MNILNLILVGFLIRVQAQQTLQELDDSIRTQAFQRLAPLPKTGVIYNVTLDSNGNNVRVQAVRLRSGSLRRHGLVCNEFNIPVQSLVETTSKYVVLVYRQFLSSYPAPLPENYTLDAPVLGIKVYEGNDLTNTAAQEVNVFSGPTTISVQVPVRSRTLARAFCALYDEKQSNWKIFNVSSPQNVCELNQLVDSSLAVVGSPVPSPAPSPALVPSPAPSTVPGFAPSPLTSVSPVTPSRTHRRTSSKSLRLGLGLGLGGLGLGLLAILIGFVAVRMVKKARISRMEFCSENGESLQTALIGGSRAPAAGATRTKPVLENNYVSP